jgi:hypothetical protein
MANKYFGRGMVALLEDLDSDEADISTLIRSSIWSAHSPSRRSTEYRRCRRRTEEGYDELDFA